MSKGGKLTKLKSVLKKWNSFGHKHSHVSTAAETTDGEPSSLRPVFVGKTRRRYLVSPEVVGHPLFRELVDRSRESSEEEEDTINVACEVVLFEHLLWMLHNADPQPESLHELVDFYAWIERGHRFGFVSFSEVTYARMMALTLDKIFIRDLKLWANCPSNEMDEEVDHIIMEQRLGALQRESGVGRDLKDIGKLSLKLDANFENKEVQTTSRIFPNQPSKLDLANLIVRIENEHAWAKIEQFHVTHYLTRGKNHTLRDWMKLNRLASNNAKEGIVGQVGDAIYIEEIAAIEAKDQDVHLIQERQDQWVWALDPNSSFFVATTYKLTSSVLDNDFGDNAENQVDVGFGLVIVST
ncbi:hypothetical protein VNO78_03260 [Psophocarpus tetragonolobus]|uniref:Uncharacterized protein n=1 Tax=Psophocarpus tetragonolobus TaxID=3891 RepID=A0AAN9T2T1_PSOTE